MLTLDMIKDMIREDWELGRGMLPIEEGERYRARHKSRIFSNEEFAEKRLSWEDIYPNSEQRKSAEFDARFYRQVDYSLRNQNAWKYHCDLHHQNP